MKPPIFHRMFDYNASLLPNEHLEGLERGASTIEQAQERTGHTIGYPGWGLIYYLLLSHLDRDREEVILETGSNWGCTTIILAQALIDAGCRGRVITVELKAENAFRAKENFAKAKVSDRIEIYQGDSREILPVLVKKLQGCRFAFLDASHLYNDVMFEFETLLPSLADDALVLFDNTYQIAEEREDQRVNGALRTITDRYRGNLINLEFVSWYTPGLAMWQKMPKLDTHGAETRR